MKPQTKTAIGAAGLLLGVVTISVSVALAITPDDQTWYVIRNDETCPTMTDSEINQKIIEQPYGNKVKDVSYRVPQPNLDGLSDKQKAGIKLKILDVSRDDLYAGRLHFIVEYAASYDLCKFMSRKGFGKIQPLWDK
jgi:hypothetical protein